MSDSTDPTMRIQLSPAQVDRVVRGASATGNMSVLLSGLLDMGAMIAAAKTHLEDTRFSSSLLYGLLLLAVFPADGAPMGNAQAARMLDIGTSTAHRYISTLAAVGLLERDPATRQYRLAHVG
jgi:hypothetical protein